MFIYVTSNVLYLEPCTLYEISNLHNDSMKQPLDKTQNIKNRAFIHEHYNMFIRVTDVFTLFFRGKWIWGTCLSERTTAQRNSPIMGTGSFP